MDQLHTTSDDQLDALWAMLQRTDERSHDERVADLARDLYAGAYVTTDASERTEDELFSHALRRWDNEDCSERAYWAAMEHAEDRIARRA